MAKFKLIFFSLIALFVLWVLSWFGIFNLINSSKVTIPKTDSLQISETINPQSSSLEASQATLTIDFGNAKSVTEKVVTGEPTTAFSALVKVAEKNNLELRTKEYDFGVFVESIDGYQSTPDMAWIYFVNGKAGTLAADKYEIVGTDTVEWKYIKPSE